MYWVKQIMSVFITLCLYLPINHANVFVIVHANSPLVEIHRNELKRIYMNRRDQWKHGGAIQKAVLRGGDTHKELCRTILRQEPKRFERYWVRLVFTGQGIAPVSLKSDSEMLKYVSENKNSLGYVSAIPQTPGIKVLKILD
ncbi:hypothetical protein HOF92_04910 [bacterium]|nr:hypothetical protein [bacterium]